MIKRLLLAPALIIMACCFMMSLPASVQAKDLFGSGVCTSPDASTSAVCTDNSKQNSTQDPFSGKHGVLIKLTDIVAYVGGAAAIIMIMYSAFRFITSGSDISTGARHDNDVEEARRALAGALIGLVVIVLAHTIILFVLSKV